ncbi:hypothetical protein K474DRAFT_565198 [Panus rudis PR-1116 ss-1]|nr:hypothetical protein K474DRAFT_565198 [Panus rudis PR-1116 ss-1]
MLILPSVAMTLDPGAEFNRIRHSLSLLESYLYQTPAVRNSLHPAPLPASSTRRPSTSQSRPTHDIVKDVPDHDTGSHSKSKSSGTSNAPGMLGHQGVGGYYSGPTSAVSHLVSVCEVFSCCTRNECKHHQVSERDENDPIEPSPTLYDRMVSEGAAGETSIAGSSSPISPSTRATYDEDIIALLPPIYTVDGLLEYYFEYCNWIYRHVNQSAFLAGWERFKSGVDGNRIILAIVCILIALTVRYLPPGHSLLASLTGTCEEIGRKYYDAMLEALNRYHHTLRREGHGKGYTLDLVELLLVRCHYLTFAKEDPEETWSVRGELVSMGTAMGLHRDPGHTRFSRPVAERRRWAWWHIILLERWQAFMFGRPLAISSHHFNTRLPADCDPNIDKSGRLYVPNIALFRLANILGEIMEDAVSFRAVSYTSIQEGDKLLTRWMDTLPPELDLDEYRVARSLGSPITSVRRLGVQSVIIRTAYHHIRFTLHRPYAQFPPSLEIAVSAASQLIALVGQTRPDFLSNTALAVPGHMNWGPFHVFSAAMFFSFQLIAKPDQPAASLFRENIRKSIVCLEQSRWMPVADKALTILQALAPLYSDGFASDSPHERERKKAEVLTLVRTLAFPYQEPPQPRSMTSPSASHSDDAGPAESPSALPVPSQTTYAPTSSPSNPHSDQPVSSLRWAPAEQSNIPPVSQSIPSASTHNSADPSGSSANGTAANVNVSYQTHGGPALSSPGFNELPAITSDHNYHSAIYTYPADESSMWGASIGFGLGEWAQFLDVMQRSDIRMRNGQ